ncbi:RNA polymerase sigma factor [Sunxiuqinia sp. A32]|uniref:RNA polymerase sigma factor n=1 Tax=Sunxiuqinia sp. A32 TaxID=3461496 RepID=UPI004045844D
MLSSQEKIILKELKQGNEEAYKQLFEHYYESLVLYCQNLSGNRSQAEDIVQETFIKIWNNRNALDITTSIRSYLYRSVYNNFIKEYTKKVKAEKILLDVKRETLNNLIELDREIYDRKIKLIENAIEELPRKCKKVFLMSKVDGYKYKEIAKLLSISEKAVEKHISRAIARIKENLKVKSNLLLFSHFVNLFRFR